MRWDARASASRQGAASCRPGLTAMRPNAPHVGSRLGHDGALAILGRHRQGQRSRPPRRTARDPGSGVAGGGPRRAALGSAAASSTREARRGTRSGAGRTRARDCDGPGRSSSRSHRRRASARRARTPFYRRSSTTKQSAMRPRDQRRVGGRRKDRPRSARQLRHDRPGEVRRERPLHCSRCSRCEGKVLRPRSASHGECSNSVGGGG